ncbi:signal peptide containing protein [Theileria equi strain WA]|uniref:Signal peptide containing protein n=1 Tax=Theileria equi strain WA TaxID=1537102 RepID=L1LEE9_THEEQ|nr:signal peptide containing protein [Theileria equi strain WA]EKX73630.1 signal peptide containing protein [Theileria equi strain WA]|eukprot:XP_004833082.1 signal peptide containing protein [Theileria equi strain WA]
MIFFARLHFDLTDLKVIIIIISLLLQRACALPPSRDKNPIDLDISGPRPKGVLITKSVIYNEGCYYSVRKDCSGGNKIGDVSDGGK